MSEKTGVIIIVVAILASLAAAIFAPEARVLTVVALATLAVTSAYNTMKVSQTSSDVKVLSVKADENQVVTEKVHMLVNSAMGEQLMATLMALRAVYTLTTDPEEKKLAEVAVIQAEEKLAEHQSKQTNADKAV